MGRIAAAVSGAIILWAGCAEALCLPSGVPISPIHGYVAAFISSLSYADEGVSRLSSDIQVAPESITKLVADVELAARAFECAARSFNEKTPAPIPRPENDIARGQAEVASRVSGLAHASYLLLAKNARDFNIGIQQVLDGQHNMAQLAGVAGHISASNTDTLRQLPIVSTAIANILVHSTPGPTNRMDGVRITTRERDALVKQIDVTFGARAKAKFAAGMPYVVAAASLLRGFLVQPGWRLVAEPPQ